MTKTPKEGRHVVFNETADGTVQAVIVDDGGEVVEDDGLTEIERRELHAATNHAVLVQMNKENGGDIMLNFMAECEKDLERLGGWGIDFGSAEIESWAKPVVADQFRIPHSEMKVSVIDNVIPESWCKTFNTKHEEVGFRSLPGAYHEQYLDEVVLEQKIKNNSLLVELTSPALGKLLFDRTQSCIPEYLFSGTKFFGGWFQRVDVLPVFRFLRYREGQGFKPHHDPSRLLQEHNGKKGIYKSMVTIILFLNDASEFEGGEFRFVKLLVNPVRYETLATVKPVTGRCAVFRHNELHEGEDIVKGTKYIVQCDVLYIRVPEAEQESITEKMKDRTVKEE